LKWRCHARAPGETFEFNVPDSDAKRFRAILWLEKARSANLGRPFARAWLAAYALKGDLDRATAEPKPAS